MDFDGKEELVIVNWVSGGKGGHSYDVYDIDADYSLNKKENPPFDEIEQYFTKFDKSSQTIVNSKPSPSLCRWLRRPEQLL